MCLLLTFYDLYRRIKNCHFKSTIEDNFRHKLRRHSGRRTFVVVSRLAVNSENLAINTEHLIVNQEVAQRMSLIKIKELFLMALAHKKKHLKRRPLSAIFREFNIH